MLLVDIIIIAFLALGFFIGFKHGVFREIVSLVGVILVTCLSFVLKNPISVFMYNNFPFFKFNYLIKGSSVINILLYEIIAFMIVFSILMIILKIVIAATNLFEKLLKMTVILSIPSKILGGIVGLIKNYIIVFLILYIISLPLFPLKLEKTIIGKNILTNTPVLQNSVKDTVIVFSEISNLVDKYKNEETNNNFDQEALDLLIKYNAITKDNAKKLIENGKLKNVTVD